MAIAKQDFPDEDLFRKWQKDDPEARHHIWVTLWEQKYPLGIFYCKPHFSFYTETADRVHDITTDALSKSWILLDQKVRSKEFDWDGAARFHSYFHKVFYGELSSRIKKEIRVGVLSSVTENQNMGGQVPPDGRFTISSLVHDYCCLAELLNRCGRKSSAEVAQAVALYIKCEVAMQTERYATCEWEELPLIEINLEGIEALLNNLVDDVESDIGRDASSPRFRDFLMKVLCAFELPSDDRSRFCQVLGVAFTKSKDSGGSGRLTRGQLQKAYKERRTASNDHLLIDEAFQGLRSFLRSRDNIDQKWRRFKKDLEQVTAVAQQSESNQMVEIQ